MTISGELNIQQEGVQFNWRMNDILQELKKHLTTESNKLSAGILASRH